jgi:hypothetical protein
VHARARGVEQISRSRALRTWCSSALERVPNRPRRQLRVRVIGPDGKTHVFYLGAHTPRLAEDDVELIHRLWLDLTQASGTEDVHHCDVVHLALRHLADDLTGPTRASLVATFTTRPTRRPKVQQEERQDEGTRSEA